MSFGLSLVPLTHSAIKCAISADAKLLAVLGKSQVTMFKLTGIVGKHLAGPVAQEADRG